MKELAKKIKQENRKIVLKKYSDKLLLPIRKLKMTNQNICAAIKEYIEKRQEVRQKKLIQREEARKFQSDCQKRYEDYLSSYDPNRIGDRERTEQNYTYDYAVEKGIPCRETKTSHFTEMGKLNQIHYTYPWVGNNGAFPCSKTELEGVINDVDGKFAYVIASSEKESFASKAKINTIKRNTNGKFIQSDRQDLFNILDSQFEKLEKNYRDSQHNHQM